MHISEVLIDAFSRINEHVRYTLSGLDVEDLVWKPGADANTIAWLAWHLSRVEDDHLAEAAGSEQIWLSDGWCERFNLPFDRRATGYGFGREEVDAVRVDGSEILVGYQDAVHARSVSWLRSLSDFEFDRVVDRWNHEDITLAVRLVSVLDDAAQHVGQAAYVRGLLGR